MDFRIYYGDGSTFEGRPEDAPEHNVQCIAWDDTDAQPGNCGRVVLHEWDIYIYSDDIGWHGTNKYGDLLNHLGLKGCGPGGVRAVLQGAWIPREQYKDIYKRAETEPPFKRRSSGKRVLEDGTE